MNPDTNRFEPLHVDEETVERTRRVFESLTDEEACLRLQAGVRDLQALKEPRLLRPDGTEVPDHWTKFAVDETVEIKGYTFRVGWIGESAILFEPVGLALEPKETG
jgi:hypothetical protein